ncbi:hypothetical protein VPH35_115718 [Triticum aestivum]
MLINRCTLNEVHVKKFLFDCLIVVEINDVLVLNELMVCYFLQKKKVLGQVLTRWIGNQNMHLPKKKVLGQVLIRWIGNQKMHLPWRGEDGEVEKTHTHTQGNSEEESFGANAYKVDWKPEDAPSKENGFGASAYKVDWNSKHAPSKEEGFGASAYKVDWKPEGAPSEKGFGASAYKVDWKSEDAPSKEGFGTSAYKVDWKPEDAPFKEKGFGASAYKVDWKSEDAPSKKSSFDTSADAVHWDLDHAHSPSSIPGPLEKRRHIKFQTGMLFLKKNLHIGTTLPKGTMFARDGAPKSVHFASTQLESKYFTTILSYFRIPHGSVKAKQIADTLRSRGKPADKEEPHMCFSYREAMARFATRELGVSDAQAAITRIRGHETSDSMYVVEQITQINSNVVPCHPMDFPYEVFYCHQPKRCNL